MTALRCGFCRYKGKKLVAGEKACICYKCIELVTICIMDPDDPFAALRKFAKVIAVDIQASINSLPMKRLSERLSVAEVRAERKRLKALLKRFAEYQKQIPSS
jgi:hypothetical protein